MMDAYKGTTFRGSAQRTEEFQQFAEDFKEAIAIQLPGYLEIIEYSIGHFYVSGFIGDARCMRCTKKDPSKRCPQYIRRMIGECNGPFYLYFSISDVRHFKDKWYTDILIRRAKDTKDYTGGSNGYTTLAEFGKTAQKMMQRMQNRR